MTDTHQPTSTRPYLIRALYEWCTDNGFTPYVAVLVDHTVQVPREFVKNGEIVLDISFGATSSLKLDNEFIAFKARFGGIAREIMVPIGRVAAIYASENGEGMAFPPPVEFDAAVNGANAVDAEDGDAQAAGIDAVSEPQRPAPRDASRAADGDAAKIFHLVSTDSAAKDAGVGEADEKNASDEPPRSPPAGGGAKPSLKRIK